MKLLVYISLVVVLTAPLVWAWRSIRAWLGPEVPFRSVLLRILCLCAGFILYASLCLWAALFLMGMLRPA